MLPGDRVEAHNPLVRRGMRKLRGTDYVTDSVISGLVGAEERIHLDKPALKRHTRLVKAPAFNICRKPNRNQTMIGTHRLVLTFKLHRYAVARGDD